MPEFKIQRRDGTEIATVEAGSLVAAVAQLRLRGADLRGAGLYGADLRGADLYGAGLYGADLSWSSHWLVAQILLRAAGGDLERRKIAGLVAVSTDWCWGRWAADAMRVDPLWRWAIDVLAGYVRDGDDAPDFLRARAAELRASAPEEATP